MRALLVAVLFVASLGASQQVEMKATDPDGTTALHRAVHRRHLAAVGQIGGA